MRINSVDQIDTVTVVGAGEMGRGIAAVAALSGFETNLQDIDGDQLSTAYDHIEWSYSKVVEYVFTPRPIPSVSRRGGPTGVVD